MNQNKTTPQIRYSRAKTFGFEKFGYGLFLCEIGPYTASVQRIDQEEYDERWDGEIINHRTGEILFRTKPGYVGRKGCSNLLYTLRKKLAQLIQNQVRIPEAREPEKVEDQDTRLINLCRKIIRKVESERALKTIEHICRRKSMNMKK